MPEKPLPEDLQAILRQALQAYELARATRWRAEGEARAARRSDEEAARAFAEAQTAYIALRTALLDLAQTHLDSARYEDVRRVLSPLLEDAKAPLYAEARDLLCESHYRPAQAALEAQKWGRAVEILQTLRKLNPAYRDIADWPARYPAAAWHLGPIRIAQEFGGHGYWVHSVAFSPDGRLLASGSEDRTVKVWAPG